MFGMKHDGNVIGLYTIYDVKAEMAGPPFCAVNEAVAVRNFKITLKNAYDESDFELYFIGTFDSALKVVKGSGHTKVVIPQSKKE